MFRQHRVHSILTLDLCTSHALPPESPVANALISALCWMSPLWGHADHAHSPCPTVTRARRNPDPAPGFTSLCSPSLTSSTSRPRPHCPTLPSVPVTVSLRAGHCLEHLWPRNLSSRPRDFSSRNCPSISLSAVVLTATFLLCSCGTLGLVALHPRVLIPQMEEMCFQGGDHDLGILCSRRVEVTACGKREFGDTAGMMDGRQHPPTCCQSVKQASQGLGFPDSQGQRSGHLTSPLMAWCPAEVSSLFFCDLCMLGSLG